MVIKVYISGISGNKEVKKRQQRVMMILESKNISYECIDITEPGKESDKEFMQQNSKARGDQKHPLPPQIFNDEEYCGDFEGFDLANENDILLPFLHMAVPIEEPPVSAHDTEEVEEEEEEEESSSISQETPPKPKVKLAPRPKPAQPNTDDDNLANGTGDTSSREHTPEPDTDTGDTSRDAEEKKDGPGESTEEATNEESEETKHDEENTSSAEVANESEEKDAQNSESTKEEAEEEETNTKEEDEEATDQNADE